MLIFDMDGTLIDSNGIWRTVDETFLARRGIPYTHEYYEGVAHTAFSKAAVFTKEFCHLEESLEEIKAEWLELAGDMYATSVPVKPGVVDYLEKCKAAGERMVLLTSSVPVHCRTAMTHLNLLPFFERLLISEELGLDKREPEIYHKAAEIMGVKESGCAVFDDSIASCRAAKAAGMNVIGVYDDFFHGTWEDMEQVCNRTIRGFWELL